MDRYFMVSPDHASKLSTLAPSSQEKEKEKEKEEKAEK
jgi:hypothetical protein